MSQVASLVRSEQRQNRLPIVFWESTTFFLGNLLRLVCGANIDFPALGPCVLPLGYAHFDFSISVLTVVCSTEDHLVAPDRAQTQ